MNASLSRLLHFLRRSGAVEDWIWVQNTRFTWRLNASSQTTTWLGHHSQEPTRRTAVRSVTDNPTSPNQSHLLTTKTTITRGDDWMLLLLSFHGPETIFFIFYYCNQLESYARRIRFRLGSSRICVLFDLCVRSNWMLIALLLRWLVPVPTNPNSRGYNPIRVPRLARIATTENELFPY